jgi:myxalamid-type polyketide synthase MxaC
VLALQHEFIPPQLHFREVNPRIALENTPFVIPTQGLPWPIGKTHQDLEWGSHTV